uniref:Uncharacterized protein n=1 Tax=Peronospora matthiolae TaxID=2874970 RepID=A0AAV1UST2_9STRA
MANELARKAATVGLWHRVRTGVRADGADSRFANKTTQDCTIATIRASGGQSGKKGKRKKGFPLRVT